MLISFISEPCFCIDQNKISQYTARSSWLLLLLFFNFFFGSERYIYIYILYNLNLVVYKSGYFQKPTTSGRNIVCLYIGIDQNTAISNKIRYISREICLQNRWWVHQNQISDLKWWIVNLSCLIFSYSFSV